MSLCPRAISLAHIQWLPLFAGWKCLLLLIVLHGVTDAAKNDTAIIERQRCDEALCTSEGALRSLTSINHQQLSFRALRSVRTEPLLQSNVSAIG